MDIEVKDAHEKPSSGDGLRVLPERRWPRRVDRRTARIHLWLPELDLSPRLQSALPVLTDSEVRRRYFQQLHEDPGSAALERLYAAASRRKAVTLLFTGKNAVHAAELLRGLMEGNRKPPTGSGPATAAAALRKRAVRRR